MEDQFLRIGLFSIFFIKSGKIKIYQTKEREMGNGM